MTTAVVLQREIGQPAVRIPTWVVDLATFRKWADSDDLPEGVRFDFLGGEIWVDTSMEQLYWHVLVKTQVTIVVGGHVLAKRLGTYFGDGARVTNVAADLSAEPDGCFVATNSFARKVRRVEGAEGGHVELEGSPDMVLEVVSGSSVSKDTVDLKKKYWDADIREYWLIDVREGDLSFDIFRHTPDGYVATGKRGGWLKSNVFGASFRLTCERDEGGFPDYRLEVK